MDFGVLILAHLVGDFLLQSDRMAGSKRHNSLECVAHCTAYSLSIGVAISLFSYEVGNFLPYFLIFIFSTHYLIDRFGLASIFMDNLLDQREFKNNLGPWSVIVIDQILHLLMLLPVWYLLNWEFS